jgi:hypothetical protein
MTVIQHNNMTESTCAWNRHGGPAQFVLTNREHDNWSCCTEHVADMLTFMAAQGPLTVEPIFANFGKAEPPALAHSLNKAQLGVVEHFQSYNVPAAWFIGETATDGAVEVIAVSNDLDPAHGFIWSFKIEQNGEYASSEAGIDPEGFSTGIEI